VPLLMRNLARSVQTARPGHGLLAAGKLGTIWTLRGVDLSRKRIMCSGRAAPQRPKASRPGRRSLRQSQPSVPPTSDGGCACQRVDSGFRLRQPLPAPCHPPLRPPSGRNGAHHAHSRVKSVCAGLATVTIMWASATGSGRRPGHPVALSAVRTRWPTMTMQTRVLTVAERRQVCRQPMLR